MAIQMKCKKLVQQKLKQEKWETWELKQKLQDQQEQHDCVQQKAQAIQEELRQTQSYHEE